MKNLFHPADVLQIHQRIDQLQPTAAPLWGRMTPAQALAHCTTAFAMASGDLRPPRVLIGRLIGRLIKSKVLQEAEPMRRNSPTAPLLIVADPRDLPTEQQRLHHAIDRFTTAGPHACTTHPHPFFGPLTPQEWAILMHKHLDHHLRQFGV